MGISPKQPPGAATNKESCIYIYINIIIIIIIIIIVIIIVIIIIVIIIVIIIIPEKSLKRKNNVEFFHGKPGQKDVNMDLESWSISSASW